METNYKTTGFLKDPAYTSELRNFMKGYLAKFPGVERLNLVLEEIPYGKLDQYIGKNVTYSQDGKTLNIYKSEWRSYGRNGRPGNLPSPFTVFQNLTFLFDKVAQAHKPSSNILNS